MCPICGKYRELTRCVRRMRIAHPTPPRGGDICPIGTTFLGFGPTPPHGEDIPHAYPTPEAAENFRPGRRRPAESKPGPAAAAPLASTGTARTRRRPLGDVNAQPPPGAASGSRAPLVLATRWENVVSARREPAASAEADPGGSGASDCSPLPTPLPGQRRGRARQHRGHDRLVRRRRDRRRQTQQRGITMDPFTCSSPEQPHEGRRRGRRWRRSGPRRHACGLCRFHG